jgi:O-antigen/teichoic acid export membrane protein
MEEKGSVAAMRQLADNGALLLAILVPTVVGVFVLRHEVVSLLIAEPFRATTLAILPLSVLAGGIRSTRAHFCDQVFLLHSRTQLAMLVMGIDALAAVTLGLAATLLWGLVGAAAASAAAAAIAALASFALGLIRFRLQVPWAHATRIALASAAMATCLSLLPEARNIPLLIGTIGFGAAVYILILTLLSLPWLMRLRAGRRLSAAE